MSFLIVGHTHEDIDSAFSTISRSLKRNDAETIPDLLSLLPNVSELNNLFDIRSWIEPYINDIRKHTKPLHYKFQWDGTTVKVWYKGTHDRPWVQLSEGIIKRTPGGRSLNISGKPHLVQANYENVGIGRVKTNLPHWKCLFSDVIESKQLKWWNDLVVNILEKKARNRTVQMQNGCYLSYPSSLKSI